MDMTRTGKHLSDFRNRDRGVELRARLDQTIERALEDRRIVGTVVFVAKSGDIVYGRAAGFADREVGRSMREDSIFLLSSVAKPIVTAAALRLVENGRMLTPKQRARRRPRGRCNGTGPMATNGSSTR